MKKPKFTPWFPADVKPVHVGVYETKYLGQPISGAEQRFSFFDGKEWGCQFSDREMVTNKTIGGGVQQKLWRGLSNPLKKNKQKGEK